MSHAPSDEIPSGLAAEYEPRRRLPWSMTGHVARLAPERPSAGSAATRARMQRQARRDTRPEAALRALLWRRGLRYRVDYRVPGTRGRVDIAFQRAKVAVFVDGCFWHGCPQHGSLPKANAGWWAEKLRANVERDRRASSTLEELGWQVTRIWEHEDASAVADNIELLVRPASRLSVARKG